ncbi:hypothetical protein [Parapedobacter indicus]|uniref:Uncharacterized protein n=1 Tax=Parapedobacter indicus TaxID=1477437 RepID=A0A1I3E306_9SPHI|nr:hypothetical protein [Parapedobacter indicus]PPL04946.1 hypothetical protein CLV26_101757 [Parapedobacter indicus]SFH93345.1 hypothetical protein SAMN05444682_101743 [Parapedobacter indicus]
MEITELRIKNLVYFPGWNRDGTGKIWGVRDIFWDDFRVGLSDGCIQTMTRIDQVNPIHLTSEWLLRLGFRIPAETLDNPKKDNITVVPQGNHNFVWLHTGRLGRDLIEIDVQYVHQLQNLYFALSGKELEVKA